MPFELIQQQSETKAQKFSRINFPISIVQHVRTNSKIAMPVAGLSQSNDRYNKTIPAKPLYPFSACWQTKHYVFNHDMNITLSYYKTIFFRSSCSRLPRADNDGG